MKALLTVMLCGATIAICPAADKAPKLPRGVVSAEKYAEAKSSAVSEKKLIVYMWSDLETTCPKCQAGTEAAMKAYKSNKDVVLVFGQGKDTNHAPASLRGPLTEAVSKVGNAIPIVMIVDPSNEKLLAAACYKQFAEDERVFKKIQKDAQAATGAGKDDKS
ncbi:hypothetical protein OKA05_04275 [Luteolibacter arcticus]|uniref:Thioredoxin domain-containing protein n=1 Tax=Luteolibacter arcticus TaxID=1581411 RepID=A0ABT3GE87_9BACT|nr:hypothetical protein [Luteolibacter arcticus]MCW1921756.1 hypothetical protein [Luteolibacter arcticus]